ncbi:SdpI family protein [Alicyclobacillus fastidiosus]|uniref:SdpI family protein n=1 Tax=Alicyclobacillus fastidiosus TaxID=392011 RepID=A0ABV5ABH8_9BACL|nr:SdpI family protein [Alicyclobacillus fastidiosus]WEH10460.1 SdpI family protein [Alicyclobacillus fastidiosus]
MNKKMAMPWWGWLAWILAIVLGCLTYFHLPIQVPSHVNSAGKPTFFISRLLAVVYEPSIMLVIILVWHVLWRIDPKKRNYESFWSTYRYIGGVVIVCVSLIYLVVLGHLLHIGSMHFALTAYGIMFMLIANVLPRLQPNWFVGIRTPWTLSSEECWNRTHRLGGQLGIPIGILIIILAWVMPIGKVMVLAVVIPIILWVLITVVASYFYAKKE